MKKSVLVVALLLSIVFIIVLLFLIPEKNICGPKQAGEGRSLENCDLSCGADSDCVDTCGCGIINKNEKCDMGDIFVECTQRHPAGIKCINNKCTYLVPRILE